MGDCIVRRLSNGMRVDANLVVPLMLDLLPFLRFLGLYRHSSGLR